MTMAEDASNHPQAPTDRDSSAASAGLDSMPAGTTDPSVGNHSDDVHDHDDRNGRGVVASEGHEGAFVQPSSYLRPQADSIPMTPALPERAVDRDERLGLVSLDLFFFFLFFPFTFFFLVIPSLPCSGSSGALRVGCDPNPRLRRVQLQWGWSDLQTTARLLIAHCVDRHDGILADFVFCSPAACDS